MIKAALTLLSLIVFTAAASAEGSLSLEEVLMAVAKASKWVAEIQSEFNKSNMKAADVICVAARHGNHRKYLGGGRAAPYECEIGKRSIKIEADRVYFRSEREAAGQSRQG